MTVNLKEKFKKDIDYQFLLFDLAKEEIRNTPVPDNSSSVVVITKSKEEKEKEEIHNLVDQWYKQRKIQYGLERPTNREFKRHFCTIEKCIKEIYCLNDNGNSSSSCPKVYVCNEGGVYHVCKVDSNCKSKYIGRDRMYYCIYSQLMVEQELVSEFDGKAKFDGMGEGNDADEEMTSTTTTTMTMEGKDGIKIYQEMDYNNNNDFDNLEEELMKAFDEQEEEQQKTKKIEKPKPNSSILSKLKKFKMTMERQKNNGGSGDSSLLSATSGIKSKINRNKFNHLYRFKKPKIKYTLSIATSTTPANDIIPIVKEEEETSQPSLPLIPIKIPLTKCKQNEIIKLFDHVGRPLFLDELGDDKQRKYIDNLYNDDDNEEEQEIEENKPFFSSNNNNNFLVPITIYGNEQTNLDSLCSIRRHSLRQSDRIISEVKLIIHDLLFNNTERMKINNFHLSAAKEKAYNEVKRYYKEQFVIELTPPQKGSRRYEASFECNVPYPRIGRPLISVGDDIYDSIIETVKFLPLLKRVQEEMVDFLCSIILDMWFLIISTDYYYSIGSSKFDISKHTISMLYMMKRDFLVDVTLTNNSDKSVNDEKELLVVFPKNKFLCLMMPRKRDLAKFNSIVYLDGNDKKHIENIGKVKYQRGDATDGKNHIDHAIKSITDPIRRKRYLLELRNRFEKHKIYWLKDVKTLTTLLNEAISERSKIMR